MNISTVKTALTSAGSKAIFKAKKYSPEILLGVGLVSGAGSIFLACKATLKVNDLVDEHKEKVDQINHASEKFHDNEPMYDAETGDPVFYTDEMRKKDLTVTYIQTGVNFLKLYGPAIGLAVGSVVCILTSHGIMRKRGAALLAAFNTMSEAYQNYRDRVVKEHGEHADYLYAHNLYEEEVEAEEVNEETGRKKKVKKTVLKVDDPNNIGPYAKYFDEFCEGWDKNADYNYAFLRAQQVFHNQLLNTRGHVFLNDIYDALGIPRTPVGSQVGWVLGNDVGDDFIDFGIFDGENSKKRDFVNGRERSILLDFNVQGPIYNLI